MQSANINRLDRREMGTRANNREEQHMRWTTFRWLDLPLAPQAQADPPPAFPARHKAHECEGGVTVLKNE